MTCNLSDRVAAAIFDSDLIATRLLLARPTSSITPASGPPGNGGQFQLGSVEGG